MSSKSSPSSTSTAGASAPANIDRTVSPVPFQSVLKVVDESARGKTVVSTSEHQAGYLNLSNGIKVAGFSFGATQEMTGEVVFNTGMVGYPEALTDPSYRGQILVLTFPLVGNYGVPGWDLDEDVGLPKNFESKEIHIRGLIVSGYTEEHSHWNAQMSLGKWLADNGIPALFGVDTRFLTKILREEGSLLGRIAFEDVNKPFEDPCLTNLVREVSVKEPVVYNPTGYPSILAYDCGMKYNIIRTFVRDHNVKLTVVPFDFEMTKDRYDEFDGIFISNGPGNPEMVQETITSIKKCLAFGQERKQLRAQGVSGNASRVKPIFGICLGNQVLALAAGAKTFKLKYGNRGMNQPCIDLRTARCYITAQNHGYAVDDASLPLGWKTLFMNANDYSNEGIIHETDPYFSVQFHPEASGGPMDTPFLFDNFLQSICESRPPLFTVPSLKFKTPILKKCLIVGSGGLSIGQAGEFDYSGSQCIKALKEENIETILINPNIATVQTMDKFADHVYFVPVTPERVLEVILKERPDSIIVTFGGQTALNVGVQLWDSGDLQRLGVAVLGTPIDTIKATEDREIFAQKLAEINEFCAKSFSATSIPDAVKAAAEIGYPVLVRAAYALGGLGSGFAENEEEFLELVRRAFAVSPQVLIDEDLRGWKEVEYEVVRDCMDNCLTVCNMENFDPLGIHTGDSIVIAPSQTLSNSEYFMLRKVALKVVRHLGVVGECNIQYALHPYSERYVIVEVNARLSRSSALASKATGYPLAYVAAKLAMGKDLVSVKNSVTRTTTACFEPSLDYIVAKMPRWDLKKFPKVNNELGSAMKSVGEVMAIGRSFEEVIQKAVRMVDPSLDGFGSEALLRSPEYRGDETLEAQLKVPTALRLFAVARALELNWSVDRIHALTKIDRWFLSKLERIFDLRRNLTEAHTLNTLDAGSMRVLKCAGFSDRLIGRCLSETEFAVRHVRVNEFKVRPSVKQIDTLAAEFPAHTNYLYTTYNASSNDVEPAELTNGVVVLGGGPYCIGSSVEFDWCAVSCTRTLRQNGIPAIVINCNPETVSTDYDESNRLYFEELTLERVLDIYQFEQPMGLIVSVGGQIPNVLSVPLAKQGCNILGTSPESIDLAEDRSKFSSMMDRLGVDQPAWASLTSLEEAKTFGEQVGFPVLVRPSYVLSGAAMRVASNADELEKFLVIASSVNVDHPVVITKFYTGAKEIEFDGVAQDGLILNYAISEHVENAGVHSGDATLVLPAQKLYVETIRQIKRIAGNIARELKISGPFNMQFLGKDNTVKIIECNLRASRSFPFVSKTFQTNFIELATKVMTGLPAIPKDIKLLDLDYVGVKCAMFSFGRLAGADPTLGVEMVSTGEVACYGQDVHEAFLLAFISAGFTMPKNKRVLFSVGPMHEKLTLLESARQLQGAGYKIFASEGTASFFLAKGVECEMVGKESILELIKSKGVDLVINVSDTLNMKQDTLGYKIRRASVDYGISLVTNAKVAELLSASLIRVKKVPCYSMDDFYQLGLPSVMKIKALQHRERVAGAVMTIQE
ncbi:carbamoyl-phosphate synthase, large subunit [Batrachochytrium salamandrivorans]|nr:carbamoyl-phosphate synthase, large subunit [Batrachochytrium salamandrivorans]